MSERATTGGVAAVLVRARDVHRVARWYAEVLGFDMDLVSEGGRYGTLETASGTVQLAVVPRPDNMPAGAPTVAITWRVEDLEARLERVRPLGVTVAAESADEQGRYAFLRDPEGNEVALWQAAGEPTNAG